MTLDLQDIVQLRLVWLLVFVCLWSQGTPLIAQDPEAPAESVVTLGAAEPGEESDYWITVDLSSQGAVVTRLQLNRYENEERTGPLVLLQEGLDDRHSYALTTQQHPELFETHWDVVTSLPFEVVFQTVVRDGTLQIEKRYHLDEQSYLIELEVEFRNIGPEPLNEITYDLGGGVGLPIESAEHSPFGRKVMVATLDKDNSPQLETLTPFDIGPQQQQAFRGVPTLFWGTENRFFTSLVIHPPDDVAANRLQAVEPQLVFDNVSVVATSRPLSLEPGAKVEHRYLLFNGPKDKPALNEHSDLRLPLITEHGEFLFLSLKYIAGPIDAVLRFTGSLLGDYGLALILTTVLVRICMVPLTLRQRRGNATLARLKPRQDELKEEYGKDKKGLADAQMALYRQENFNPFGGCLVSFAVTLLFIGAWQGLLDSFPLRHAELLWGLTWIHDLSAPDRLFSMGGNVPLIGSDFNLLPVLALLLTFAGYSMYADSAPADGAKKRQIWWPIFFCWLCYNVPASSWLCILTFLVGTRVEQILIPLPQEPAEDEPSTDSPEADDSVESDDDAN